MNDPNDHAEALTRYRRASAPTWQPGPSRLSCLWISAMPASLDNCRLMIDDCGLKRKQRSSHFFQSSICNRQSSITCPQSAFAGFVLSTYSQLDQTTLGQS